MTSMKQLMTAGAIISLVAIQGITLAANQSTLEDLTISQIAITSSNKKNRKLDVTVSNIGQADYDIGGAPYNDPTVSLSCYQKGQKKTMKSLPITSFLGTNNQSSLVFSLRVTLKTLVRPVIVCEIDSQKVLIESNEMNNTLETNANKKTVKKANPVVLPNTMPVSSTLPEHVVASVNKVSDGVDVLFDRPIQQADFALENGRVRMKFNFYNGTTLLHSMVADIDGGPTSWISLKTPTGTNKIHMDQVVFLTPNPNYPDAVAFDKNTTEPRNIEVAGDGTRTITIGGIRINNYSTVERGESKMGFPFILSEKVTGNTINTINPTTDIAITSMSVEAQKGTEYYAMLASLMIDPQYYDNDYIPVRVTMSNTSSNPATINATVPFLTCDLRNLGVVLLPNINIQGTTATFNAGETKSFIIPVRTAAVSGNGVTACQINTTTFIGTADGNSTNNTYTLTLP